VAAVAPAVAAVVAAAVAAVETAAVAVVAAAVAAEGHLEMISAIAQTLVVAASRMTISGIDSGRRRVSARSMKISGTG
jgi:hypothetical protein